MSVKTTKSLEGRQVEAVEVLGVPVHKLNRKGLTEIFEQYLKEGRRGWFGSVNVHAINIAQEQHWFKKFFQDALITYCDGEGVRLGAWFLGEHLPERVALTDWIHDICAVAERNEMRVYFFGSTHSVIELAVKALKSRYPRLQIVGWHHGYLDSTNGKDVIQSINACEPHILVVGMGMPRQEGWIADNFSQLDAQVVLDAGSCFDYVAGVRKRCPAWMGEMGFEWLYRLGQEPRRLWRRYLIGNPLFLYRILRESLSRSSREKNKPKS